jgi:hypothetical protein
LLKKELWGCLFEKEKKKQFIIRNWAAPSFLAQLAKPARLAHPTRHLLPCTVRPHPTCRSSRPPRGGSSLASIARWHVVAPVAALAFTHALSSLSHTRPLLLPLRLTSLSPHSSSSEAAWPPRHCWQQSSPSRSAVVPTRGQCCAAATHSILLHRTCLPSLEVRAMVASLPSHHGQSSGEPWSLPPTLSPLLPLFHAHWLRLALAETTHRLSHLSMVDACHSTVSRAAVPPCTLASMLSCSRASIL